MDPDEGNQYVAFVMPILDLHKLFLVCLYEEIMRLMSTIDSKGNYKPFKSNVAAMAYLLAHSPRPMVIVQHYLDGIISHIHHITGTNKLRVCILYSCILLCHLCHRV